MKVSLHARGQLLTRMPAPDAVAIIRELEQASSPKQDEARIIRRFSSKQASDRRWGLSNGGVLVAIVIKGEVWTVYWRREGQPMDAEHFRVERVRDMTPKDEQLAAEQRVAEVRRREAEATASRLRRAWGAR